MKLTLLYTADCPHGTTVDARLRAALAVAGRADADISYVPVRSQPEAERLGFRGSPTVLVDGVDLFPGDAAPPGLACRLYGTSSRPSGSPSTAELLAALRRRLTTGGDPNGTHH